MDWMRFLLTVWLMVVLAGVACSCCPWAPLLAAGITRLSPVAELDLTMLGAGVLHQSQVSIVTS